MLFSIALLLGDPSGSELELTPYRARGLVSARTDSRGRAGLVLL